MKAITQDRYGSPEVMAIEEVDPPAIKDREVLVRVRAAAANPGDILFLTGTPYVIRLGLGFRGPRSRVRGMDVAGTVEAVGKAVTRFQPGDEVFGQGRGTFAEYTAAHEDKLVAKPANLTFEQAAALPVAGLTALHALRDHGKVGPGQRVLINGASGGIGTFAVQIAKSLGAHVTGVCSTRNVELVRSLGADEVIDYTQEDLRQRGQRYDFILDNVSNHSLADLRRLLTDRGTLIPNNGTSGGPWIGTIPRIVNAHLLSLFVHQRLHPFVSTANRDDLLALRDLAEAGALTPVIDRTYQLDEAPEAVRQVQSGHARGKVVITV